MCVCFVEIVVIINNSRFVTILYFKKNGNVISRLEEFYVFCCSLGMSGS